MKRKYLSMVFVSSLLASSLAACTKNQTFKGTAKGRNGDIEVEVTYQNNAISNVKLTKQEETKGIADGAIEQIPQAIVKANSYQVDVVSGATITSKAIMEAVKNALESGGVDTSKMGKVQHENVPVTFQEGTYSGKGTGYNGEITLNVTFGKDKIDNIEVTSQKETNHIGTVAFPYLIEDAKKATGSGIDVVSGATFTSKGFKDALLDAAKQAKVSDENGFASNTYVPQAQADIQKTYDVVVVGAGGAGMAAAVQAAQEGNRVAVIEENAEIGGNTIASGGQYQSMQQYLVFDPNDPEATSGEYKGQTYAKVKMANGNLEILKTILNWDEKPFDESYFQKNQIEFVAGDIEHLSKAGVHQEYLETLKELKKEIQTYMAYAQPKLDAGQSESQLTLFSSINLHIFQSYYGGLRQDKTKSKWIYGDVKLVKQFVEGGQELKGWLEDQGALFDESIQPTIVGALWNRENDFLGCDLDQDGVADPDGANVKGKSVFNTYIATTRNTLLNTVVNHEENQIYLRTKADELIEKDGRVIGVNATMYDGTKVQLTANKGVILATGGYAANIEMVMKTNEYWKDGAITSTTRTTNRSSLVGDGITMAQNVGAAVVGMGYTQMMPISWIDNGNLAFGGGNYAIYIDPTTGKRYVNETAERDTLSLGEFEHGIQMDGSNGVVIEIANSQQAIPGPYPYGTPKDVETWEMDVNHRQYTRTVDQLDQLFKELGIQATGQQVKETIETYDRALMTKQENTLEPTKTGWSTIIGQAKKDEQGNYLPDTYTLDGVKLKIRLLAPSTHHTMGGVQVDEQRHVLTQDGKVIPGLYAAGEVTGGIHGGNRLGGNAIVEIFVSGRIAASSLTKDAQ